jgi:hypothetical protein
MVQAGGAWTQQSLIPAPTNFAEPSPCFGCAVAISADTALIGAKFDLGTQSGLARVYERAAGVWTLQRSLGPGGLSGFQTGAGVAVQGDLAFVGIPGFEFAGTTPDGGFVDRNPGAVQAFDRINGVWTDRPYADTILPSDWFEPDVSSFGQALALDGDVLVVGAHDAAYAFGRSGEDWLEERKLTDGEDVNFGSAVSASNATALVGAPGNAGAAGRVFVYTRAEFAGFENGEACAADLECVSQHCAGGICCSEACNDACSSCRAADKACGPDGECGPVKSGTDPRGACRALPSRSCGTTGLCDGEGACALWPAGTECATCSGQNSFERGECDGAFDCVPSEVVDCDAGSVCGDGDCVPTCFFSDCPTGLTCNAGGYCVAPTGAACTSALGCASMFCVDGVCCESACDGVCSACNEPGHAGECVVVSGTPRGVESGARPRCNESSLEAPCLEPICDGLDGRRCAGFVGAEVTCGEPTCSDNGAAPATTCNGAGECESVEPAPCGAYACEAGACKTSCAGDEDCAAGHSCHDDSCVAGCQRDDECAPFKCEDGACLTACDNSSQCSQGYRCSSKTHQCVRPGKRPPRSHCSVGAPAGENGLLSCFALSVALLVARRRGRASA